MNSQIQIIKLKNFKSYQKTLFIGPFHFFTGILGENGTGKTNLIDAIIFFTGKELSNIKFSWVNSLFSSDKKSQLNESQVGIIFSINRKNIELIRTINYFNNSDFFIEGKKVSLNLFRKILKGFKCHVLESMFLKNPTNNKLFTEPFFLSKFINMISGSKNLTLLHLKILILKKKLQENCSFFFYKLKFINKQKTIIENQQRSYFSSKKKIIESRILSIMKEKEKGFIFIHKFWKNSKTLEKNFRKFNEIGANKRVTNRIKMGKKKYFKKILILDRKLKKFLNCFFWAQTSGKGVNFFLSGVSWKFIKEVFIEIKNLRKKGNTRISGSQHFNLDILSNLNWRYKFLQKSQKKREKLGRIPILFQILKKNFFSRQSTKTLVKKGFLKKTKNFKFLFFSQQRKIFLSKKIQTSFKFWRARVYILLFQSKRFFFKIFHFSICLIFFLVKKKENLFSPISKSSSIKKEENFLNLSFEISGVRGRIVDLMKPLEKKIRILFLATSETKENIVLVDNQNTIKRSLSYLRNRKKAFCSFLPINLHPKEKIFTEKLRSFSKFFDFDLYDQSGLEKIFKGFPSVLKENLYDLSQSDSSQEIRGGNVHLLKKGYEIIVYNPLSLQFECTKEKNFLNSNARKKSLKNLFQEKIFQEKTREKIFLKKFENLTKAIKCLKFMKKEICSFWIFFFKKFKKDTKKKHNLIYFSKHEIKYFFNYFWFLKNFFSIKKKRRGRICFKKVKIFFFQGFNLNWRVFFNFFSGFYWGNVKAKQKSSSFFFMAKVNLKPLLENLNLQKIQTVFIQRKKRFLIGKALSFLFPIILSPLERILSDIKQIIMRKKTSKKLSRLNFSLVLQIKKEILKLGSKLELVRNHVQTEIFKNQSFFFFPKTQYFEKNSWLKKSISFFFNKFFKKKIFQKKETLERLLFSIKRNQEFAGMFETQHFGPKLNFFNLRLKNVKKELKKNRHRFYITNSKYNKITLERKKRFLLCVEKTTFRLNLLYKEITSSVLNPLGGTAFLNISNHRYPFLGEVSFTAIPPFKKIDEVKNLSGGEKTIAAFVLFFAFSMKIIPPFIFFDEIDSYLDNWYSNKVFTFLLKWAREKKNKIGIITFKLRFYFFFGTIFYIFLNRKNSQIVTLNPR